MDKIRWNQLFTPRTLKRGYELYQSGAVEDIQHNEYAIKGSIFDDDDYYSIVYLRDGMIEDMDCSCEMKMNIVNILQDFFMPMILNRHINFIIFKKSILMKSINL